MTFDSPLNYVRCTVCEGNLRMCGHSATTATMTMETLQRAFDAVRTADRAPHVCMVHPNDGICHDCGRVIPADELARYRRARGAR